VNDAMTLLPAVPAWSWPLWSIGAVAACAASWWALAGANRGRKITSVALRVTALFPAAAALLGLATSTETSTTEHRPMVLVVDGSLSMDIRQGSDTRAAAVDEALHRQRSPLRQLAEDGQLEVCWAGAETRRIAPGEPLPPTDGLQTDYLASIEACTDGRRPSSVVLIGDGADRGPLGAAGLRRDVLADLTGHQPYPVHTIAVGGTIEGDLEVTIGDIAPFAFVRRPVELPVRLRSPEPGDVTLQLLQDGQPTATRTVTVADEPVDLTFRVVPQQQGYLTMEVRSPVPIDDPIASNNRDACTLHVVRDRTRVLQLSSHPSWDVRFLRRFFSADPNVDLVSFYIMRTGSLSGLFRGSPLSLIEFPHEELFGEDLVGFDLVVLQNFTLDSLPTAMIRKTEYMRALADYVRGGGALLVVGGDDAFQPGDLDGGDLAGILPLRLGEQGVASGSWPIEPTPAGLRHPVMRLAADADENQRVWESLAPIEAVNVLGSPSEGAVLLAAAGGQPLLAVRTVGQGRVMQLATDGSWRWGMAGDAQYAALWRAATRWLVRDEDERLVDVRTDRETYSLGDEVRFEVQVFDADYSPRVGVPVELTLGSVGVQAALPARQGMTSDAGLWTGTVAPPHSGAWWIAADAGTRATARFTVRQDPEELSQPEGRPEQLAALSDVTGGQVLDLADDLAGVAAASHTERTIARTVSSPAWDRWPWLLLCALPLGVDWWLKRRWGNR